MGAVVDPGQVLEIQMGVDLGGAQVGVAEQLLHRAQVAGGLQHMGGERVAQLVRMQVVVQAPGQRRPAQRAARLNRRRSS